MEITKMTPRELVAGLMRGNARTLQQGYSPVAATIATAEIHGIDKDSPEFALLQAYAEGFIDGFVEDGRQGNPAV